MPRVIAPPPVRTSNDPQVTGPVQLSEVVASVPSLAGLEASPTEVK